MRVCTCVPPGVSARSVAYYALSARGFLPKEDPLTKLPAKWAHIDELGSNVPRNLRQGTLQGILNRLLPCPTRGLSRRERELLMVRLSFLASAYVFSRGEGECPASRIPRGVAIPLVRLARQMGRPPILSYASYCLHNFYRPRPYEPLSLTNIGLIQNFLGTKDENWFVYIHVVIEQHAAGALHNIVRAQEAVEGENEQMLLESLQQIFFSLWAMYDTLARMREGCSPEKYYREVRPYIFGFQDITYDDVYKRPRSYRGETGAQSSIVPSLIAAFGIRHKPTNLTDHLEIMKDYMPPAHRRFIASVKEGPSIPHHILLHAKRKKELAYMFNACLEQLYRFRALHFELAHEYIAARVANPHGTGGTPFVQFLAQMRDETQSRKLLCVL